MSFSDFLRQFSRLEICSLSPDSLSSEEVQKWSLVLFNGRRTWGGPAGGGRNHPGEGTGCPGRLPRLVLPEPGVLAGSFPSSVLWLPGTTRGPAPPLGHGDQGSEVGGAGSAAPRLGPDREEHRSPAAVCSNCPRFTRVPPAPRGVLLLSAHVLGALR